jgi:hypothetical protein
MELKDPITLTYATVGRHFIAFYQSWAITLMFFRKTALRRVVMMMVGF